MLEETQKQILKEIVEFGKCTLPLEIAKIDINELKRAFPFLVPFFTDEELRASKKERSIVTSLGKTLIPRIAELIAREKYTDVKLDWPISGEADQGMVKKIETIVDELRAKQRQPNASREWKEIMASASGHRIQQQVRADLYIGDFTGGPLFVELKSPLPNLDVCEKTKTKMLKFRAIMHVKGVTGAQAYMGLWYNPYIERNKYSHQFTGRVMDMNCEVLLGEELWDKIGGPGTYKQLLDVLEEAATKIRQR